MILFFNFKGIARVGALSWDCSFRSFFNSIAFNCSVANSTINKRSSDLYSLDPVTRRSDFLPLISLNFVNKAKWGSVVFGTSSSIERVQLKCLFSDSLTVLEDSFVVGRESLTDFNKSLILEWSIGYRPNKKNFILALSGLNQPVSTKTLTTAGNYCLSINIVIINHKIIYWLFPFRLGSCKYIDSQRQLNMSIMRGIYIQFFVI